LTSAAAVLVCISVSAAGSYSQSNHISTRERCQWAESCREGSTSWGGATYTTRETLSGC